MPRAVAYVRVSTNEQNPENQTRELRELAERLRLGELDVRAEVESSGKRRPVLDQVMADARARRFEVLVVWALDRLDRSMVGTVQRILELDRLGVRVVSLRDGWLDTDGPARSLLLAVLGWVAEQERVRISDRTRAGLARVRAAGKRLGRRPTSPVLLSAGADRVEAGKASQREAAAAVGVSRSALQRELRRRVARKGVLAAAPGGSRAAAP